MFYCLFCMLCCMSLLFLNHILLSPVCSMYLLGVSLAAFFITSSGLTLGTYLILSSFIIFNPSGLTTRVLPEKVLTLFTFYCLIWLGFLTLRSLNLFRVLFLSFNIAIVLIFIVLFLFGSLFYLLF